LSSSMESVLQNLSSILQLRLKYDLGWAGAETLHARIMQMQKTPEDVLMYHRQVGWFQLYLFAKFLVIAFDSAFAH
jgi:hypothetical protein